MREELGNLIYPVFRRGLSLKERLDQGERLDLAVEQAELRGMLKAGESQRWPAYVGDGDQFLGIRYALVSWLDEVFSIDCLWEDQWRERTLEFALFGTRIRAEKFWEQERLAKARTDTDALEAFYLCVMLGFRGDLREKPAELDEWREAAEAQLNQGKAQTWSAPPELRPPTYVPPLTSRDRLRRVVLLLAVAAGIVIPATTFTVFYLFGK
jgi:type VI secretion system protein ImpK